MVMQERSGLLRTCTGLARTPQSNTNRTDLPPLARELPSGRGAAACRGEEQTPAKEPCCRAFRLCLLPGLSTLGPACPMLCPEPLVPTFVPEKAAGGRPGGLWVFPRPGPTSLLPGTLLPPGCEDSETSLCGSSQPRVISPCPVVSDLTVWCWSPAPRGPAAPPRPAHTCPAPPAAWSVPRRVCSARPRTTVVWGGRVL